MKFVCENCKAKYQIGDDKVSGKTVRMKCRRCGHLILVSATVTESSVAKHAPAEGSPLGAHPTPPPGALSSPPVPQGLGPTGEEEEDASTVIMTAPAALRMAPPARPAPPAPRPGGVPAAPARPAPPAPPKPGLPARPGAPAAPSAPTITQGPTGASPFVPAAAPSAPSVADLAQRSMASAISAAARGSSNPLGPSRAGGVSRGHLALAATPDTSPAGANHLAPVPAPAGNAPSVVPPSGGVAGAFQRAVAAPPASALRADTPGEDWYVGVGGVPIGPVRLSVIREKVEQGAVDGESLVWREGFEEWQPLRNVPGLRAILDEPRRATNPTPPPDGPRASISSTSLPRVSANPQSLGVAGAGPAPAPSHEPALEASGHGALALGNVPTGGVSLGPAVSPPAAPEPPPADPLVAGSLAAGSLAAGVGAPATAQALSAKPISLAPPPPSVAPPPAEERKKGGMHPFAYAMIAMAAVFGGVAAWVLFIKPPPAPVVVVKTVTADPGLNAAPPPPPTTNVGDTAPTASVASDPKSGPIGVGGGPRPATSGTAKVDGPPPPNAGSFDNGVSGPTAGPGANGGTPGQGKLSEGEIQGVVSRNQSRVRRQCWQPALDSAPSNAPKSARVSTTITIGPSGSVSSVSASGSESTYPGLASCIAGAIKGWSFPPSEGPTTVNIPFSFNAQ